MQKTPPASRSVLSQSTGGPGISSGVTVAPASNRVVAEVVSERAVVGAGGPGLSSGLTVATTFPCSADAKGLPSPPFSPAVESSGPQNSASDLLTAPRFTLASDDIQSRMTDLMQTSSVTFDFSPTSAEAEIPMEEIELSSWYAPDDKTRFLRAPEELELGDIFVRPSYVDVYSILNDMWQGAKSRRVQGRNNCALITGTPGIGKSVFGRVLVKWIMERPKPALIFYRPLRSEQTHIFWQGMHFRTTAADASRLLIHIGYNRRELVSRRSHEEDMIEIWSIADAQVPIEHKSINQVCITSPRRSSSASGEIKSWVKDNNAQTFVLPPCEWDEMLNIRWAMWGDSAEEHRPLATLEKGYKFWGGIPRTLIEQEPQHLQTLSAKFRQLTISDALPFLGTYNLDYVKHSEAFFHLRPLSQFFENEGSEEGSTEAEKLKRKYMFPVHCWATEPMSMEAWNQFQYEQETNVIRYINTIDNEPAARGKWFEQMVYHLMGVAGISGELRNLESGTTITNFSIPSSKSAFFTHFGDINLSSEYWRPVSRIHKTCDSYLPSKGLMFQMTVGETHPINMSGLEELLQSNIFADWEKEHPDEKLKMIFVVHPSVYKSFKKQTYLYSRDEKSKNERKQEVKQEVESKVTQYVMMVDLEQTLRVAAKPGAKRKRSESDIELDNRDNKKQKV